MSNAQIHNPNQAFAAGSSWNTAPFDVTMNTDVAWFANATAQTLYTGDIVAVDATGGEVILTTTGNLTNVIGCVGNPADLNTVPAQYYKAGTLTTNASPFSLSSVWPSAIIENSGYTPPVNYAWQSLALGFTNGSGNITSAASTGTAATVNPLTIGAQIITPYNASTNATPQVFQVTSNGGSAGAWTAVGAVISGGGTTFSGTTGTFTSAVGIPPSALGPGFIAPAGWSSTSTFPPGEVTPVITRGFGRVNIDGVAAVAASDGLGGTNASVIGTRFAYAATGYASATGLIIAVALEAYASRDTGLRTALGITGHDSIRAIIGKM